MNIIRGPSKLEFCTSNFPSWVNDHFDTKNFCWIEIQAADGELYKLLCKYGTKFCKQSFRAYVDRTSDVTDEQDNPLPVVQLSLGAGLHQTTYKGKTTYLLHATTGDPVGTDCGAKQMESITVFMEGRDSKTSLKEWFDELLSLEVKDSPEKTFRIYRWHIKYQYWRLQSTNDARELNSVVLPEKTKQTLVDDLSQFLSKKTKAWYKNFGIPYKRSYIFYGPPGTGKTSMIQALAGAYNRNVCFLQPNDREFNDDAFKTCLQRLPAKSILVLEDIDALFHCRQSRNAHCPLTFTGLLNGLDGIGNPSGQIFILTTNHLEHLDAALIRCGRVDLKFEFGYADDFQLGAMFKRFYPTSTSQQQEKFRKIIRSKSSKVVMADLQQLFILNMNNNAEECLKFISNYELKTMGDLHDEVKRIDEKIKKERDAILETEKEAEALKAEREKKEKELFDKKIKAKIDAEYGVEEEDKDKKEDSADKDKKESTDSDKKDDNTDKKETNDKDEDNQKDKDTSNKTENTEKSEKNTETTEKNTETTEKKETITKPAMKKKDSKVVVLSDSGNSESSESVESVEV